MAFTHDGRLLARGQQRNDTWEVLLWDVVNRKTDRTFRHDLAQVDDVNFSPDDQLLLYSCGLGIGTYDMATDRHTVFLQDDCVQTAAMSSDHRVLAASCPFLDLVRLWSISRDREIGTIRHLNSGRSDHVMFGDDDRLLVTAFGRSVNLWNLAGPDERLAPDGHVRGVPSLAFNRDGTVLASAGETTRSDCGTCPARSVHLQLSGFHKYVQTVAFSHDGAWLATGDWAGDIQIWDAHTGERIALVAKGGRHSTEDGARAC